MDSVSVIMPAFNSELTICNSVNSVLNQSKTELELIVVDDCSKDKTRFLINDLAQKDSRIKYVGLEVNSGAGAARNKGIELAQGRFIAFLDADDLWHPDKLERQINFMKAGNHPFSFTAYAHIDQNGNETGRIEEVPVKLTYNQALFHNQVGCLTAIYDSSFFGKEYMPLIRKRQDYALWLSLLKKAPGHGLNEVLAFYRNSPNSISSNKLDLIKYQWKLYYEVERLGFLKSALYTFTSVLYKFRDILNSYKISL